MTTNKIDQIILQQQALKIYFSHFHAFVFHLKTKRKNKKTMHKMFDEIIQEKTKIINTLQQLEKK